VHAVAHQHEGAGDDPQERQQRLERRVVIVALGVARHQVQQQRAAAGADERRQAERGEADRQHQRDVVRVIVGPQAEAAHHRARQRRRHHRGGQGGDRRRDVDAAAQARRVGVRLAGHADQRQRDQQEQQATDDPRHHPSPEAPHAHVREPADDRERPHHQPGLGQRAEEAAGDGAGDRRDQRERRAQRQHPALAAQVARWRQRRRRCVVAGRRVVAAGHRVAQRIAGWRPRVHRSASLPTLTVLRTASTATSRALPTPR
jgi:hypothetical protein